MIADLRKSMKEASEEAMRLGVKDALARQGKWSPAWTDITLAIYRLIDQIDDVQMLQQVQDREAPKFLGTVCCGADASTPHWIGCRNRLPVDDPSSYWHEYLDR